MYKVVIVTAKISVEVQLPQLPNFLIAKDGKTIPIGSIPRECLEDIADKWKAELLLLAERRSRGE